MHVNFDAQDNHFIYPGIPLSQAGVSAQDSSCPRVQWMASRLLVRKEADMLCVERRLAGVCARGFRTAGGHTITPSMQRSDTFSQKRKVSAPAERGVTRLHYSQFEATENVTRAVCARPTRKRSRGEQLVAGIIRSTP